MRTWPVLRSYPKKFVRTAVVGRRYRDDFAQVRSYVMFIGYPRSGHTLVGAMLDAHPNVVIAHELDALRYVAAGYRRSQLFTLLVERAVSYADRGLRQWGYEYAVPGQWQARWQRLDVIGDKRGGQTTRRLRDNPALLELLAKRVRVPVKMIHVVRDPYDNIATIYNRSAEPLEAAVDEYLGLAGAVAAINEHARPGQIHEMHHDDLVADATVELGRLCGFVGVTASPGYVEDCASIVFPTSKRTRDTAPWTPELLGRVERATATYPWLARYCHA